jgi:DnaJ family protein C protein 7
MTRKKKSAASKKLASESSSLTADTANQPPVSPTPGPSTPIPESQASSSTLVEPPQPQPAPGPDDVQTDDADEVEDVRTQADTLKEQGNVFFKNKDYTRAVGLYTEAISESGH